MPRKLPPHCERWRDRHGKLRVYFRKGSGPRVPLPVDVDSDEFKLAYAAALSGEMKPKEPRRPKPAAGTIAALIASYRTSAAYISLRTTTKQGYEWRLVHLLDKHGHRSVFGITRERIANGILKPFADRPGAALSILKMLRVLIRHAIEIGMLKQDPSLGIKRPKTQEVRSWTDVEIETFEAHWPTGSKQRLAFALHLYTGQRRSDVHRMTWADVTDNCLTVRQQKTGRRLIIPLHESLREVLAAAPREHVTIVNTAFGKPFTVDGYSRFMRDAIAEANLPLSCQPHGLRKAAGRRLAEAGCSAHEIMAILGHTTLSEAERYTREADQARLAAAAIMKLEGRKKNKTAQTTPEKVGEERK
jgi:integrase